MAYRRFSKAKIDFLNRPYNNRQLNALQGFILTVDHIDVDATLKTVQQLLAQEAHLSPALRSILEVMIVLVKLMANRLSLNSRNSSQPPSSDRFAKGDKTEKNPAANPVVSAPR